MELRLSRARVGRRREALEIHVEKDGELLALEAAEGVADFGGAHAVIVTACERRVGGQIAMAVALLAERRAFAEESKEYGVVRAGLLGIPKDKLPPVNKIYDFTLAHQVNAELDAGRWKPAP